MIEIRNDFHYNAVSSECFLNMTIFLCDTEFIVIMILQGDTFVSHFLSTLILLKISFFGMLKHGNLYAFNFTYIFNLSNALIRYYTSLNSWPTIR